MIEIIKRAEHSDHWGHMDGVKMGDAKDMSEFATLVFHESGHDYHGFGTTGDDEMKCYDFTKLVCQRLGLPYSDLIEEYGVTSALLIQFNSDEKSFISGVANFPPRIKELLCLSGRDEFVE